MISINLEKLLEKKSITKYRLSKDTGLDPITIRKICNGETTSIEFRTIDILCDYFECDISDLIVREKIEKKYEE